MFPITLRGHSLHQDPEQCIRNENIRILKSLMCDYPPRPRMTTGNVSFESLLEFNLGNGILVL